MRSITLFLMFLTMATVNSAKAEEASVNMYSFSMQRNNGEKESLADYKGKVVLVVNTASRCGFTPQYKGLEELYLRYKDRGFVVLAFPANNFMGQEPGSDEEIKSFCALNYKTTFPLYAKTSVKGADINPLFKYLTEDSLFKGPVSWNFNKFLVDGSGKVIARFDTRVNPLDPEIVATIERALPRELP